MDIKKLIGYNIRALRELRAITQSDLGKKVRLHGAYIGSVERGERNISVENLLKIARALSVPVHILLTEGVDQWIKG